ncbi:TRAP transporter small permease [Celeribacter sp.]|uniref:TRAP transporter small permease n=1 Tax=Celeribacter sp. TaxID=1890673 RepID=UPI003A938C1A
MYWVVEKSVGGLARAMAVAGGASLLLVIALTCISVIGRALDVIGLQGIPGDIELVEFGIGFAVFSALPYAQYARAHARVDMLQRVFGDHLNRLLDLIGDLLMAAFTVLVAWRLYLGMLEKDAYGETSFILQIPVVWGYRAAMVACAIGVIVALFCVLRSARALIGKEA